MYQKVYGYHTEANPRYQEAVRRQQEKEMERQPSHLAKLKAIRSSLAEKKAEAINRANRLNMPKQRLLADIEAVARIYNLTLEDVLGKSRTRNVVRARQAAIWMVWYSRDYTLPAIGRVFGKDHTSCLFSRGQHMIRMGLDNEWTDIAKRRLAINNARTKAHYHQLSQAENNAPLPPITDISGYGTLEFVMNRSQAA
ncbi:hypothetical protein LJR231_003479 [Phyllobacterium sp. LjRoot231]|uniref:helix-turn-helix domain-containing protein n=1 Tax=Phyllobacterium sp. LjRoot231 TaxID=3342289 RepID=UPI003ED05B90